MFAVAPRRIRLAAALLVSLAPGIARAQDAAPKAERPKRPEIYDAKADARAQVADAAARAKRDHKRVLVMFGGNWCGWCHKLHDLFRGDRDIAGVLRNEYELVLVDLEAPHAAELLKACKEALSRDELQRGVGYPFLAVLDGDGKVVTAQRTDPLEEGDHHDPKRVKDFLVRWAPQPLDARTVVGDALAQASSQDKRIFLHFGAPWCGWCHRLDEFLARPEVAEVLDRDFIDVKIDLDRMAHAKDVQARFRPDPAGGIPWFAFLDAKGAVLATADGPKGNVGYPLESHEIDQFLALLKKTARRIEPAQLAQIEAAMKDAAERIKAGRPR